MAAAARADRGAGPGGARWRRVRAAARRSRTRSSCPQRLSLFGLTRLPAGQLAGPARAGRASRRAPVPAAPVAGAVGADRRARRRASCRRAEDPTAHAGRATACSPPGGRTRASCSSCSGPTSSAHEHPVEHRADTHARARCRPPCARIAPPEPGAADGSIEVHACHGRARQVEVRARRDPAPARGGPDARAARRDRDVPGHRGVRAADPGHVRRRRDRRGRPAATTACPTCACGSPTARCARPTRCSASSRGCSSWPAQRLTASQVLDFADREPVRRRFRLDDDDARAARGLGRRERHPLGAGRRAPRAVQALRRCPRGRGARGWTGCWSA